MSFHIVFDMLPVDNGTGRSSTFELLRHAVNTIALRATELCQVSCITNGRAFAPSAVAASSVTVLVMHPTPLSAALCAAPLSNGAPVSMVRLEGGGGVGGGGGGGSVTLAPVLVRLFTATRPRRAGRAPKPAGGTGDVLEAHGCGADATRTVTHALDELRGMTLALERLSSAIQRPGVSAVAPGAGAGAGAAYPSVLSACIREHEPDQGNVPTSTCCGVAALIVTVAAAAIAPATLHQIASLALGSHEPIQLTVLQVSPSRVAPKKLPLSPSLVLMQSPAASQVLRDVFTSLYSVAAASLSPSSLKHNSNNNNHHQQQFAIIGDARHQTWNELPLPFARRALFCIPPQATAARSAGIPPIACVICPAAIQIPQTAGIGGSAEAAVSLMCHEFVAPHDAPRLDGHLRLTVLSHIKTAEVDDSWLEGVAFIAAHHCDVYGGTGAAPAPETVGGAADGGPSGMSPLGPCEAAAPADMSRSWAQWRELCSSLAADGGALLLSADVPLEAVRGAADVPSRGARYLAIPSASSATAGVVMLRRIVPQEHRLPSFVCAPDAEGPMAILSQLREEVRQDVRTAVASLPMCTRAAELMYSAQYGRVLSTLRQPTHRLEAVTILPGGGGLPRRDGSGVEGRFPLGNATNRRAMNPLPHSERSKRRQLHLREEDIAADLL